MEKSSSGSRQSDSKGKLSYSIVEFKHIVPRIQGF